MGNILYIKVILVIPLFIFSGCKVTTSNQHKGRDSKNTAYSSNKVLPQYKKADELLSKWTNAHINGDDIGLSNYTTELYNIATKEKGSIKSYLERYLSAQEGEDLPYVFISLALAGFTNDCSFLDILQKYVRLQNKELVSNALLGISRLNMCSYSIDMVWDLLMGETDETVILNALQVVLNYNFKDFYKLESIVDKFIRHRNPLIQNQSIRVVAKYKLSKYTKMLVDEFLSAPLTYVRMNTAVALCRIGDKSIIRDLIDKINEPSFIGKKEAVYVLENLTGKKFGLDSQSWLFWYLENSKFHGLDSK